MKQEILSRRNVIVGGAAISLLALPGCATSLGSLGVGDAIKRLLTISSQRAFARLMEPNGFYDSQVAQIDLPPQLGGSGASGGIVRALTGAVVKDRLLKQVNRAAEVGAKRAAPIVMQAISGLTITDALGVLQGGPTAATSLLENSMGDALFNAMLPGVGEGLRMADNSIVTEALRLATGIDFQGLANDVSRKASRAIYRAIGQEEAAIRANPSSANDTLLFSILSTI